MIISITKKKYMNSNDKWHRDLEDKSQNKAASFNTWMAKIGNIYYANDKLMAGAFEKL